MTKKRQLEISESIVKSAGVDCCACWEECTECTFTELCPCDNASIVEKAEKYVNSFKENKE